jgi:hypothetical protein
VGHRTSRGILPQTPVFSLRSARVVGRRPSLPCSWLIWCFLDTSERLLVGHRTSWGILPQTPVFSLRSARVVGRRPSPPCSWLIWCFLDTSERLLVGHRQSWGILPQTVRPALLDKPDRPPYLVSVLPVSSIWLGRPYHGMKARAKRTRKSGGSTNFRLFVRWDTVSVSKWRSRM